MINEKIEDQVFIFSSNMENPEVFFQGYCFHGMDYIFGEEGFKDFYNEKGITVRGGEDGCYVSAEKIKNNFIFYSDFSGNKKIFYYWTTDLWVVSNSIFLIVDHLKKNNVVISPNCSQLSAIGLHKGPFFNQLYSVNTFVNNVKLLPLGHCLNISKEGYSIGKLTKVKEPTTYEESLSLYIGTWIARLAGLLTNGIKVQSDLTGGADSRTVFALLKKAAEKSMNANNVPVLRSGTKATNKADLEIATEIASTYDIPINSREITKINMFSGEESFLSWKLLCLGVYHPIYFPSSGPQHHMVSLGGGGAENHRPFYKYSSIENFINHNSAKILPSWLSHNFIADIKTELQEIINLNSEIDPLILHYRKYRNRIHSGRTPQYTTSFTPLGSKLLEDVSEVAGNDKLKEGQINYDLMATLLPTILGIKFDSENKSLNESRKNNLVVLEDWKQFAPGNIYKGEDHKVYTKEKTDSALELLNYEFQIAKQSNFAKDFFGSDFIDEAENIMLEAIKAKKFPHAIDGQSVVAIIAAGIFE